jgi:type I restriction enzyme M protein
MNLLLRGVDNPDFRFKDSQAQEHTGDEDTEASMFADPSFASSLDCESTSRDLLAIS